MLDLEANRISKFDELNNLKSCFKLTNLTLEWNPISFERNYRKRVARMLESVQIVDDYHVESLINEPKNIVDIDKLKQSATNEQLNNIVHEFYFTLPHCILTID